MSPDSTGTPPRGADILFDAVQTLGWEPTKPAFVPPAVVPVEQRDEVYAGKARSWCHKSLEGKCADLAAMEPDSGRNHALNAAAWKLLRYVQAGHLDSDTVVERLRDAALECGLGTGEIEATLGSAQRAASRDGALEPPITGGDADPFDALDGLEVNTVTGEVQPTLEELRERAHQRLVATELATLRARDEAKTIFTAEKSDRDFREPPYRANLTLELREPRLPTRFAVEQLLPSGGNALLTAQYKAGKTTFVTELARAWVDGVPFLDRFTIHSRRRVALWNYELSQNQYDEWLEQAGIEHTDDISVLHLRGFRLDLRTPKGEAWAAAWLAAHDTGLWVPDPFARAAVGVDENSNTEVGQWLDTLDVIKGKAGVDEAVLPVHTGRAEQQSGQERARGATRLDDWADVRWLLTKDDQGERYFRATGRDVEMDEEKLVFDADNRRLTISGGDRQWHAKKRVEDLVVAFVVQHPGSNGRAVLEGIGGGDKNAVPSALARAVGRNVLRMLPGKGPEKLYFPAGFTPSADPFGG